MSKGSKAARYTPRRAGDRGPTARKWAKQKTKTTEHCAIHFTRRWKQRVNKAGSKIAPHEAMWKINTDIVAGNARVAAFVWRESNTLTHWRVMAAGQPWHVVYNSRLKTVVTVFPDPIANGGELKRLNQGVMKNE